jgi:integrase
VIRFLYDTACRIGELENLLWVDVYNTPVHHVLFRDTKGGEAVEAIAITPEMYELLMKLPRNGDRVFNSSSGCIFARNEFGMRLKKRAELCKINKRIYPHLFRHTKITHLTTIYKMPIAEIAKFARHKDPKTTMRYTHPALVEMLAMAMASPFEKSLSLEHFIELGRKFLERLVDTKQYNIVIKIEPV